MQLTCSASVSECEFCGLSPCLNILSDVKQVSSWIPASVSLYVKFAVIVVIVYI